MSEGNRPFAQSIEAAKAKSRFAVARIVAPGQGDGVNSQNEGANNKDAVRRGWSLTTRAMAKEATLA